MAEADEIILPISVDPRDAEEGLKQFEGASTRAADVFKGVLGAQAVAAVVQGAGKALQAFAGFFGDGIEAAKRQEVALTDLATQLEQTGGVSQEALDGFTEFAAEIQRTTLIADDAVLGQIALAKSFDLTDEQATRLVQAATELSAVTGMSLDSAVKNLGKSYSGLSGELGESLPLVRSLSKEQLQAGEAIDAVLERYGGAAAAKIDNFTGQVARSKDEWANLAEAFGEVAVQSPQLKEAFSVLADALVDLQGAVKGSHGALNDWLVDGIAVTGAALSVMVDAVEVLTQALNGLITAGAGILWAFSKLNEYMALVLDVTFLNTARVALDLLEVFGVVEKGTGEAFNKMVEGVRRSMAEMSASVGGFADDGLNRALSVGGFFRGVSDAVDGSVNRILAAEKRQTASTKGVADEHERAGGRIKRSAADMARAIEDAAKLESEINRAIETDIEKAARVRGEFAARIKEQLDKGNIDQAKAAELSVQIEADYQATLAAIREEADAASIKAAEDAANEHVKVVEAARSRMESIASNPIAFLVRVVMGEDEMDFESAIAAGVGSLNQALSGAEIGNSVIEASEEGARNIESAEKLAAKNIEASAEESRKLVETAIAEGETRIAETAEETEKAKREAEQAAKEFLDDALAKGSKAISEANSKAADDILKAQLEGEKLVQKAIAEGDPQKIADARERAAEIETKARAKAEEDLAKVRKRVAEAEAAAKEKAAEAQLKAQEKAEEDLAKVQKQIADDEAKAKEAATQAELDAKIQAEADIAKAKEEKAKAEREAQEAIDAKGRENMTKVLSAGGAAIADAFLPGIGPAVGPLIEALSAGPDAAKAMIKAFVSSAPDIVIAIAESMPVVIESLIEELVTKGGALRIAVAIVKGLIQAAIGSNRAIGAAIFAGVDGILGDAFADGAGKVTEGIQRGAKDLFKIGGVITRSFVTAGQQIIMAIGTGAQELFKINQVIIDAYIRAGEIAFDAIVDAFEKVLEFDKMILDAVVGAFQSISIPVPEVFGSLSGALKGLSKTPGWLQTFIDIVNQLLGWSPVGRMGGGDGWISGEGQWYDPGEWSLASGITEVPPGFPNDTFPAKLSSFERVVDANTNGDLKAFLSDYQTGRLQAESESGRFDPEALQILRDIATLLARSNGRPIVVQMDKRELARGNLGNSRLNARTA